MRDLVLHPAEILREVCSPIEDFGPTEMELSLELAEVCRKAHGAGLAAPQIGVARRMFVVRVAEEILVLLNPVISEHVGAKVLSREGCLSIPDKRFEIERSPEIVVEFQDMTGKPRQARARGFLAFCVQHELDHLNGRLVVDHGVEVVETPLPAPVG